MTDRAQESQDKLAGLNMRPR
ncbi:MAG: hypothetical protein QOD93_1271, partial [Acetobacteraceae bacterium]|nr:hypothetical protein [Acetobacteraceae bacterium]